MNDFLLVSIILLALVIIDAIGDAFRIRKWQIAHHAMEVVGIAIWIAIWASFEFRWEYIVMYITGRIWLFDTLLNIVAGYKITYSGKSSLYDRLLTWFTGVMKEPGHLIWVIRVIALMWWIAWALADGGQ